MQRFYNFLVVLFLMIANNLNGQITTPAHDSLISVNGKKIGLPSFSLALTQRSISTPSAVIPAPADHLTRGTAVDPAFYVKHFGVFCKAEWMVEKKTRIPLRLRVGSLEYVDRLEGKKR